MKKENHSLKEKTKPYKDTLKIIGESRKSEYPLKDKTSPEDTLNKEIEIVKKGCKKKWSYSNKEQGIYERYLCSNSSKGIKGTYSLMLCDKCKEYLKGLKFAKKFQEELKEELNQILMYESFDIQKNGVLWVKYGKLKKFCDKFFKGENK